MIQKISNAPRYDGIELRILLVEYDLYEGYFSK